MYIIRLTSCPCAVERQVMPRDRPGTCPRIVHGHRGFTADARIAGIGSSIVPRRLKFLVASLAALRIASSASLDWARSTALILTPP